MVVSPMIDAALAGILGLLVGSFLNVVIHRLPKMMFREWLDESADNFVPAAGMPSLWQLVFGDGTATPKDLAAAATAALPQVRALPPLSLASPRSRCPACGHQIKWYENIPVVSYLALRGKCSACATRISLRYPLVELATGIFFVVIASHWGLTLLALAWAVFAAILIAQFLIDFDTQLLPDDLNYPLLWLGLLVAALGWNIRLDSAVWGAIGGYLSLWSVYQLHHRLTGKVGMGHGDFKLLAALGAWFGAKSLLALILLSSIVGAAVGGALIIVGRLAHKDIPMPFGPFIAGAGLVAMAVGPAKLQQWMPFAFPF
jgi:leader peptidase (prepilin peptidase) / N-methyltransferase